KDHYAGAVAAIEMLEHLIKTHAGKPLERFFRKLCADIRLDRRQLRNVMTVLGFQESTVRDTGAWMAEKLARTKLGFSNGKTVGLRLVESLEILQLGITGKRLLWRAMSAAIKSSPVLQQMILVRTRIVLFGMMRKKDLSLSKVLSVVVRS